MRPVIALMFVLSGTAAATMARAAEADVLPTLQNPATVSSSDAVTPDSPEQATAVAAPNVERAPLHTVLPTQYPLTGNTGALVAGAVGTLIPILFFAVPALSLAWFGPFAPVAFLAACIVATVTTAAGGAVAWGILTMFSNVSSGIFVPVVTSAAIGLVSTVIAGALATVVLVVGLTGAWFISPAPNLSDTPSEWGRSITGRNASVFFAVSAVAFCIWGTGVLIGSIGGPMTAAQLYMRNGTAKYE